MKAIKPISILFFLILISVIPLCLYLDHLSWESIKSHNPPNDLPKNEGLQLILPFGFGFYSVIFLVWLGFIYFGTRPDNFKRRVGELIGVFVLAVIPALLIEWLFFVMIK